MTNTEKAAQAMTQAAASLQDALAHQATQARENAISTLSALNIITAKALERVREKN